MTLLLPEIQPEKWRRYHFESKSRYFTVILQQNLFHEWSIIKCSGSNDSKHGTIDIEHCDSYEDGTNRIERIKKTKAAKLGLNFERLLGLLVI